MSKSKVYTFIIGFIVSTTAFSPFAVAGITETKEGSAGVKCKLSKYNKSKFQLTAQSAAAIAQAAAGMATKAN